jgi:hypothetical protein
VIVSRLSHPLRLAALCGALAAAAIAPAAFAQNTTPVVLTFSTVGDSRQDPVTYDQASVGATLTGQDAIWLQNTKAFARILRTVQTQKSTMLFWNGDMIHGYGWAGWGYTSAKDSSTINGAKGAAITPSAWSTTADVLGSDILKTYQQYGFWRGMVAPVLETGTYVFPVPGNHETQCKACGKVAKVENEKAWAANMGDLILDTTRFTGILGSAPVSPNFGPDTVTTTSPDGLTTDQSKLSYSFDFKGSHFAVVNTDPVGADTTAPTQWLKADLAAAAARGAKKFFVFGHKPAYTYAYKAGVAAAGLDSDAAHTVLRDTFWNLIEQYKATYFCGHEHAYNIAQPRGAAYQVLVGAGGSPFDDNVSGSASARPATDRSYSWATVKVHADGGVDILGYGFDEHFGPTQLYDQIYIAP